MEPTPPPSPSTGDTARLLGRIAAILCVASIASFHVFTRASFTAHLQLQYEADLDYVRGVNFLENPNPFGQGPEIGFGTDLTLDHGPAFYALMAPFVAAFDSPLAVVALQATLFGLGLAALGIFAWRRVGLLGATLAVLVWLASTAALSEWEENLWHCSALPGLLVVHFALGDRFWQRPSGPSLFWFLGSGSLAVQVYSAGAGVVLPALGLAVVAVLQRRLRVLPAAAAAALALVVSLPFLVRLAVTLPAARFVDTPDATREVSETVGDAAKAVMALVTPKWTVYASFLPSALLLAIGLASLTAAQVGRLRRRGPGAHGPGDPATFQTYLLVAGLLVCLTGAWAYRERSQERYLIAVLPTLLVLAVDGAGSFVRRVSAWLAAGATEGSRHRLLGWLRGASPPLAVALSLSLWIPAASGGLRDTAFLPPPGEGARVGSDFRLGLGESLALLRWLRDVPGIGWPDTCARVHGRFCQPAGGVPGAAVTGFIAPKGPRTPDHVVVMAGDSGARCPTDRRVGGATFIGAYGRRIEACRFRPAVLASDVLIEARDERGAFRLCKVGAPLDATWNSWGPEARDASNLWPGDNRHFRDDPACVGATYRVVVPLAEPAGTVAVEVTFEGPHEPITAQVTALGPGADASAPLALTPTADAGAIVGTVSWGEPARGLVITFDNPAPMLRFDVY